MPEHMQVTAIALLCTRATANLHTLVACTKSSMRMSNGGAILNKRLPEVPKSSMINFTSVKCRLAPSYH